MKLSLDHTICKDLLVRKLNTFDRITTVDMVKVSLPGTDREHLRSTEMAKSNLQIDIAAVCPFMGRSHQTKVSIIELHKLAKVDNS